MYKHIRLVVFIGCLWLLTSFQTIPDSDLVGEWCLYHRTKGTKARASAYKPAKILNPNYCLTSLMLKGNGDFKDAFIRKASGTWRIGKYDGILLLDYGRSSFKFTPDIQNDTLILRRSMGASLGQDYYYFVKKK
ncbi:hypothetical protein [Aquimarina celericrescens]|uniref:Lipocalin-like domain-containing protein n=1 Tax=Aquimarina celericrescens TaxID=1964542 RepID=A0ABW5AXS8_9FLAO|nr:hypothetical protein [Aquimarina celericrescens]